LIPYEFQSEAEEELLESALFYDSRVKGLGESFTSEVQRAVEMVRAHPDLGSPLGTKVRRVLVRRFPYSVIYRHEADRIFILAVAHQRRRPGYWRHRE
jgi:toxin ParE1/3/4